MSDLSLAGHGIVIAFYLILGPLIFAMCMTLPGPAEKIIAGSGVLIFFWGCAASHADMYGHIAEATVMNGAAVHHLAPLLAQAIGAPMFAIVFARYAQDFYNAWRSIQP